MIVAMDESRWKSLSLIEQMANIGSEVGRSAKWLSKDKKEQAEGAYLRALDLFDLTIKYGRVGQPGRREMLKELCRARECFVESFQNSDTASLAAMDGYFGKFALAQRRR